MTTAWMSSIVAVALIVGIWTAYRQLVERQRCEMTVMWYYPMFTHVPISPSTDAEFPQYRLVVYGEAKYHESLERGEFRGAPLLFIPGNGGKYRQVRSLGSISFMKTVARMRANASMLEYNDFALDLDEEYSALSVTILRRQTEFARRAVLRIIQLYADNEDVKHLIVVGHSMGGVIGRRLLADSALPIALLVTLATPHTPLLPYDGRMQGYYDEIERVDGEERALVVSIAGGSHDTLVPVEYTHLPSPTSPASSSSSPTSSSPSFLSITSSSTPQVWASADHLCIVWCKQLTSKTARALFDLLDRSTGQMVDDASRRAAILRRHFVDDTVVRHAVDEVPFRALDGDTVSLVERIEVGSTIVNMSAPMKDRPWDVDRIARSVNVVDDLSPDERLVVYSDRYADDVVQVCARDACRAIDADASVVLDDYWHMSVLDEEVIGEDVVHVIVHDVTDARRPNSSLTFAHRMRTNHVELMSARWSWLWSRDTLTIPADRHTVIHLSGYSTSIARALSIDVQGVRCQNTTVAWLYISSCSPGSSAHLHSSFMNNGTHDRLHVHHHARDTANHQRVCATIVPAPFAKCSSLHVTYSSEALKGAYMTMQLNAFGVRHTSLVAAVLLAVSLGARVRVAVRLPITLAMMAAIAYHGEESIILGMLGGILYLTIAVALKAILDVVDHVRGEPRYAKYLSAYMAYLPATPSAHWLNLLVILSGILCGCLPFLALFISSLLRTSRPSIIHISSLVPLLFTSCLILPSALLVHHALTWHLEWGVVDDASRWAAVVLAVSVIGWRFVPVSSEWRRRIACVYDLQ